jgi:predicted  nucleic acid-binding Zn-ribbon protein
MVEKRCVTDIYVTDLEAAQLTLTSLMDSAGASAETIRDAAVRAKRLELKLAAARVGQAEYDLDTLKSRIDFLEARAAGRDGATRTEHEELEWARGALPSNTDTVTALSNQVEDLKRQLEELIEEDLVVTR